EEQQSAAVFQDSFMSSRDRNATRINVLPGSGRSFSPAANVAGHRYGDALNIAVLTDVCDGHETNHAVHRRILANMAETPESTKQDVHSRGHQAVRSGVGSPREHSSRRSPRHRARDKAVYWVYFWSAGRTVSDEFELTDATDVHEVLRWIDANA